MRIHRLLAATLFALAVLPLGTITPRAEAAAGDNPITIAITATVVHIDDEGSVLWGLVQPGDTITGKYTYNSAAIDSSPASYDGQYWHSTAPYGISLELNGMVFETDPQNVDFLVEIVDNYLYRDNYLIRSYNNRPIPNGLTVTHIAWQLDDPTQTALKTTALPKTAPRLSNWTSQFGLTLEGRAPQSPSGEGGYRYTIRGQVTQAQKVSR